MIRKGLSEYPLKQILNFKGVAVGWCKRYPIMNFSRVGIARDLYESGLHIIDTTSYRVKYSKDPKQKWEQHQ